MTHPSAHAATCPTCAAAVDGRFCAQCGTPVDGAVCAECRTALTPGAKFCHRCGTAAGAAPRPSAAAASTALPWAFAAIALLAFGAYVAAQHFSARNAPAAGTVATTPGLPGAAGAPGAPFAGAGVPPRAPDISQMSPEERADRLSNRIFEEYEKGNSEYVQNMSPMAIAAYDMLPELDLHRRYDLGRIFELTGALAIARAHADTILATDANHLLGLILATRVADLEGDEPRRAALAQRLVTAAPAELERGRPEYDAHANDVNIALTEARRRSR